ncbi:hypothetical protein LX36DRAFT_586970, partial [Colletotrichum falcatum]
LNLRASRRFKFTLYNNYNFNYKVFINIIYLDSNKLILYTIDSVTTLNAAKFL